MRGFLVAGTASGVGKTTVTLALIAAMRQRGLVVQPFKGGPDFLDTTHHTRISGRVARNLDTWMLTPEANRAVLSEAAEGADAARRRRPARLRRRAAARDGAGEQLPRCRHDPAPNRRRV